MIRKTSPALIPIQLYDRKSEAIASEWMQTEQLFLIRQQRLDEFGGGEGA